MQTRTTPLIVAGAVALAALAGSIITGSVAAADRAVIVQPGDTLSGIALEQGVTVSQLVALNGIADPNRILAGQRLVVASDAPAPVAVAAPATHRVRFGENLTGIARRYGTTIDAIATLNGIRNPSFIRTGQMLAIPGAAAPPAPAAPTAVTAPPPAGTTPAAAEPATHRVAAGETLTGIARHHGSTIAAIAAANGIANPSLIRPGWVLVIPGATMPAAVGGVSSASVPASMASRVAERDDVRRLITAEAVAQGVPPALALAVAWQESGWQQGAVSSAGAIGIMQLIPASGAWVAQSMLGEPVNLYDAASNVRAGVRLLRHYTDRYGGDRWLVLAAYYQGQTAVDRHGIYPVTRPYVESVLELEQIFTP